jgi:hypothetical protein
MLLIVGLWEVVSLASVEDAAAPGDWEAAAAFVRENASEGDLIVFAPRWIDPVGRQYLGDRISLEMAGRMDAARYETIWEVSVRGHEALEARGLEVADSSSFGVVRVRRLLQQPVDVVYDVLQNASSAESSRGRARASLQEVDFQPRRCIMMIPPAGESITLSFTGVPRGSSVVGYVGLADIFERRDIRDPGRLELFVDGAKVAEVVAGVEDGWLRFEAPIQPKATPATLEFKLTAVGPKAKNRKICFAAEVRR